MSRGRGRSAQLVAGAAVVFAALAWLSGWCGERIPPGDVEAVRPQSPSGARTVRVEQVRDAVTERASGTVASTRETTVSSKILARISEIPVTAGSVVSEGDLLVRLDSRDLEARASEAAEDLRAAQARLELAQQEQSRTERLFSERVASQRDLDRARSALRVAEAGLEAAEQRVADARVALSYAEIRSPVTGRVVDRLAEPGDTAAPGAPLLQVYDPGALRLEAPVRETLAVKLAPGQALRVEIAALGRALDGSIDEIVPFADPGARTLLVKVRLPPDPLLYAGMFGRVEIPAGERSRLLAPPGAFTRIGQLEFARVVRADGSVERRLVTTGPVSADGRVEVLSGLSAGEELLLEGSAGP